MFENEKMNSFKMFNQFFYLIIQSNTNEYEIR